MLKIIDKNSNKNRSEKKTNCKRKKKHKIFLHKNNKKVKEMNK